MFSVIIPAAGSGSRLGYELPKAFVPVSRDGETLEVLARTVRIFNGFEGCVSIVVAAPLDFVEQAVALLERYEKASIVAGGATRQDSVRKGLEFLSHCLGAREDSVVLVHDAARCFVDVDTIRRVLHGVEDLGASTAALPVVDAMVHTDESGTIMREVPRDSMWVVQTPQGFYVNDLQRAHEEALARGYVALDDATLVRRNRQVSVVLGDSRNIKITYPRDL